MYSVLFSYLVLILNIGSVVLNLQFRTHINISEALSIFFNFKSLLSYIRLKFM